MRVRDIAGACARRMHRACDVHASCRYDEFVPSLQIKNVPEAMRDALADRARERGQSLSRYLYDVVSREAAFQANRDLIDEVVAQRGSSTFSLDDVLGARDSERTDQ